MPTIPLELTLSEINTLLYLLPNPKGALYRKLEEAAAAHQPAPKA